MKEQLSIEETYDLKRLWKINETRSKAIHKKFGMMTALDN